MQRVGSLTETHPVASATSSQRTASASPTVDPGSETLDVAGAAERLNVSGKTVRRLVKADIIPFARIGTRLWFHRQRLIEWIAEGWAFHAFVRRGRPHAWRSPGGAPRPATVSAHGRSARACARRSIPYPMACDLTQEPEFH